MGFLRIQNILMERKALIYTMLIRRDFASFGRNSILYPPFYSSNVTGVRVGEDCVISAGSWIYSIKEYAGTTHDGHIHIGDGTYIGRYAHIIATQHVSIGNNVVIADGIYISDNLHGLDNMKSRIFEQPLRNPGPVIIQDNVLLGEHVCVLPNVEIGEHSVVGSNSVVTKDVPAYSIAVGSPARVIKRYDLKAKEWRRV